MLDTFIRVLLYHIYKFKWWGRLEIPLVDGSCLFMYPQYRAGVKSGCPLAHSPTVAWQATRFSKLSSMKIKGFLKQHCSAAASRIKLSLPPQKLSPHKLATLWSLENMSVLYLSFDLRGTLRHLSLVHRLGLGLTPIRGSVRMEQCFDPVTHVEQVKCANNALSQTQPHSKFFI